MLAERDAELATLEACLDQAGVGSGRAVFLAGEAGVGKTSLVAEVVASAAMRPARPLRCTRRATWPMPARRPSA